MNRENCNDRCGRQVGTPAHATVDTRFVSGQDILRTFRDAYVFVRDEMKTYHIDCAGNPLPIFSEDLFLNGFDPTAHRYKGVKVYDFDANLGYIYDMNKRFRVITLAGGVL